MDRLSAFAETMEQHLFGGQSWPAHWWLSSYQARALLCHCLGHLEGRSGETLAQAQWPSPGPKGLYQVRRDDHPPWRGSPWETVRHEGPPPWRRGAVWSPPG